LPERATVVRDTNFVWDTKNVSDFVQKHHVPATNVSQFACTRKHHEQQCVRYNVSSFARAYTLNREKENSLFENFLLLLIQCWIEQIVKMFGREFGEHFAFLDVGGELVNSGQNHRWQTDHAGYALQKPGMFSATHSVE